VLDTDRKGLVGRVPKIDEAVEPVSTWVRELLRGWWRPIGLMVSFMIFTVSGRNILDTPSYISQACAKSHENTYRNVQVVWETNIFWVNLCNTKDQWAEKMIRISILQTIPPVLCGPVSFPYLYWKQFTGWPLLITSK
jgi:hypothetical protein